MAHELNVWLFADCVGTLALVDGRLSFRYAPDWLARPNAIAVSASLPLQAEPFDERKTRPFFAGLLRSSFRFLGRTTSRCWIALVANAPGP